MSDKVKNPYTGRMVKKNGASHIKFLQRQDEEKAEKKQRVGRPCAEREAKNKKEKTIKIKIKKAPKTIKIKIKKTPPKMPARLSESQKGQLLNKPPPLPPRQTIPQNQAAAKLFFEQRRNQPKAKAFFAQRRADAGLLDKERVRSNIQAKKASRKLKMDVAGSIISTTVKGKRARGALAPQYRETYAGVLSGSQARRDFELLNRKRVRDNINARKKARKERIRSVVSAAVAGKKARGPYNKKTAKYASVVGIN